MIWCHFSHRVRFDEISQNLHFMPFLDISGKKIIDEQNICLRKVYMPAKFHAH